MIFDTHAHYDDEDFDLDRDELLLGMKAAGVSHIVNIGASLESTKRSLELAKKYDVQLFFGKAMESDKSKGTYIMNRESLLVEEMPITGMSIQEDVVIFTLRDISNEGPAVAEAFRMLAEMGINVDMISQQSTGEDTCSVSFSCTADQGDELAMAVQENEVFDGATVDMEEGLALISLVGVGMASHSGVASSVFSTLAVNGISFYHITTSEISISVTVDMENKINAAIALSKAFDL
jgi:aspartate kinase